MRCYIEFVLTVNKLNRAKGWPFARAYAEVWLKRNKKAAKAFAKGDRNDLPKASLDSDVLTSAELRVLKDDKDLPKKKPGANIRQPCFLCNSSKHWAADCPNTPSNAQTQPSQGGTLGGNMLQARNPPFLRDHPPIMCGKCRKPNHTAAQCYSRC